MATRCQCRQGFRKLTVALDFGTTYSGIAIRLKAACRSSGCAKNISQHQDVYSFDAKFPTVVVRERRPTRMVVRIDGEPGQPVGMSPNFFTYFKLSMMEHGEWDDVPNDEVDGGLRAYAHMRLRSLAYGDYTSDLVAFYLKGLWNRACELFEPEVSNIMPRKLTKQLLPENTVAVYGVLSMRSPGISVIESEHRPFIVIDCGGMTLDGIVGKMDRRIGGRVVFEPISCKTRFAGGVSLEIRFEALVREEIGRLMQRRPDLAIDVALEVQQNMSAWHEKLKDNLKQLPLVGEEQLL
ncbi:hypothetical protein S40293_10929 [Stachybotrys chartarum IBT 40293]|nr:hypothetical protein S40293_10929 [Stachybotrys chartarum IBT 40293]